jgi:hypothetical protein
LAASAACNSSDDAPTETLTQVVARVAPAARGVNTDVVEEPGSYRIEFDRYVNDRLGGDTVGKGATRRKALKPSHFTRKITRPFDESGVIFRSLGFVQEPGGGLKRVDFVRPLPDDPRPRIFPPLPDKTSRRLVIAGRECSTNTIGATTYCIDNAGLVLMERGKASLDVATKVTIGAAPRSAAELAAEVAAGFTDSAQGSIRPIDPDSAPAGTDFSLDAPPDGFTLVGRYAVAPLTPEVLKRNSRKVVAGIVDVYVRGGDAVTIERGGKLDTSAPDDQDLGTLVARHDVELGDVLGKGEVGIGGFGPFGYREVRAFPSTGRYVVISGTLPEDELIAIARSMRQWPGTSIRYLDKAPPRPVGP